MMNQAKFERIFNDLPRRRKEVLLKFLAGETDAEIAQSLTITEATVRQHIKQSAEAFGLENDLPDERRSKRSDLIDLFIQYKPDLVKKKDITETNQEETKSELNHEVEPTANSIFVGREEAIADLNTRLQRGEKVVVIQAPGGVGKTTLAKQFLETLKSRGYLTIEYQMAKEKSTIASVESVVEEWLKKDFEEEPGREFGVTLMRLKRLIQTRKVAILIDNLEPALNQQGQFIEAHRGYVCLLQVLADSSAQSITLITTREPLCEGLAISNYSLPKLTVEAWEEFFKTRDIEIDEEILQEMHKAYGGNALAMKVLCDPIERDGGMVAYWKARIVEDNLLVDTRVENLIKEQFNRLQEIYFDAYKLLYRLGCYRYQEVPAVPEEGLFCLLWDVPVRQHRKVIEALKSRHLVEWKNQEYWLHPVIREEAVSRLRKSENWEEANQKAAKFWTESVTTVETIDDAMTALEACHHYISINNFDLASSVLLKRRDTVLGDDESLGRCFYRFSLFDKMITPIKLITNQVNIQEKDYGSELYNVLGSMYWLKGNTHKAINLYILAKKLAIRFNNKFFEATSVLNIALCHLDLWNLEEALDLFEEYATLAKSFTLKENRLSAYYQVEAYFCLALVKILLGFQQEALNFANKAHREWLFVTGETPWSKAYYFLFLGLTYTNLRKLKKAFEMFHKAIAFAEESHYKQVKAKALTGLAELYRIQEDFETAFQYHTESIELLKDIDAKCDLAEAYYQVGLTYQKIGERQKSEENFLEAIRLFENMEAPRQVEKVQKAMKNS